MTGVYFFVLKCSWLLFMYLIEYDKIELTDLMFLQKFFKLTCSYFFKIWAFFNSVQN